MITIRIDNREVELSEVDQRWINQQINRRREDGLTPCVIIKIKEHGIDMILSTPSCEKYLGVSNRQPNKKERKIFDLWKKLNLNNENFSSGNVVAFIKQLDNMV